MSAARVLANLLRAGVDVRRDGDQLRLRPASSIPPLILAEARREKSVILELLATAGAVPGPRVMTPKGPGLLRWRGYSGRLGVVLDSAPRSWSFFDPAEVTRVR